MSERCPTCKDKQRQPAPYWGDTALWEENDRGHNQTVCPDPFHSPEPDKGAERVAIVDWLASIDVPPRTALIDRLVEARENGELVVRAKWKVEAQLKEAREALERIGGTTWRGHECPGETCSDPVCIARSTLQALTDTEKPDD